MIVKKTTKKHVKCQVNANLDIFHNYLRNLFENTEKSSLNSYVWSSYRNFHSHRLKSQFLLFPPNVALCVKSWFVVFALLSNVAAVELYYGIFAAVSLSQFLLPSHSCQVGASSQLQLVPSLHFISPLLVSTTTLSDFKLSSTLYCSSLKV